jgi:glycosyltransferase involved in cell wall biosynthesis
MLTIAICTWNRCDLLRATLERLCAAEPPPAPQEWEVIVVDNNSTDNTKAVIDSFSGRLPIRRLFEQRPGLSHARNTAIAGARGDRILWTDDDVLVDKFWIRAYLDAFARWPDAMFFGGPVEPWFEGTPPEWLPIVFPSVHHAFAVVDHGSEAIRLDEKKVPFGANMAFLRSAYDRVQYDPRLGLRHGISQMSEEETTLIRELAKFGGSGRWVPAARVRHCIPKSRQSLSYLQRYFQGLGEYLGRGATGQSAFFGRPLWLWRMLVESSLQYWVARCSGSPQHWIEPFKNANIVRGRFRFYGAGFTAQ